MTDKYYTPDESEFHVGFEYEATRLTSGDDWYKTTINELHELASVGEYEKLRVKYLDKEDIESLGFTITKQELKPYGTYIQAYIKHNNSTTELWYAFLNSNNEILVTLKNSHFNGNARYYIKNKSELKQILKMINIK